MKDMFKKIHLTPIIIIALFLTGFVLTSCHKHMNVNGICSLPELEGRMLYMKVFNNGDLQNIDSSRIVHGKFHFNGVMDSIVMASLFLGEESLMPIVLDEAELTITLSDAVRKVEGSSFNDSLYAFIARKSVIDEQLALLPRRESQMILEGMDHHEILLQLNQEASILSAQEDALVSGFIKKNMNNVLGPGVFMIATSSFPYPMLTPQIEELLAFASPAFLNDAYVREFVRMARENMEKMNE